MIDAEYVATFEANKNEILDKVAEAIDAGRLDGDRLLLGSRDFPEAGWHKRRSST
jgi:hypothetical protein